MDGYKGDQEAEYLTEHFEKKDIIQKVGFDGIYAIHPVSKILAVKNKTPDILKIPECLRRLRTILSIGLPVSIIQMILQPVIMDFMTSGIDVIGQKCWIL